MLRSGNLIGHEFRVRVHTNDNLSIRGFDICIQEWNYLDEWHTLETVGHIVMERGSYILEDGTLVEAHSFEADWINAFGRVTFTCRDNP